MNTFMLGASAVLAIYRGAQRVWEWTGAALFPRFWSGPLDPAGLRLFQEAAGATQATAAGQPIGRLVRGAGSIDAAQATALSRPTLARWPKGGRRNLLTWTEDLNNVVWDKVDCSVTDAGNGAWKLREKAGLPSGPRYGHYLRYNVGSIPASSTRTLTIEAKAAERTCLAIHGRSATAWGWQTVNLLTGEIVVGVSGGNVSVTIKSAVPIGDGWWRIVADVRMIWGYDGLFCLSPALPISGTDGINYEGDGSSGVLIRFPQLEVGPDATPYQKVTTPFDVTEAGVPDIWHLWNDGGDSLLAPLPTGTYEVATVGIDGKPHYASLTGDGSGKNILLGSARIADIFARTGTLSDAERLRLEEYWQQRYGAGYLIPPGMVPGARQMWETSSGGVAAVAAGQPVGSMLMDPSVVKGASLNPASAWTALHPGTWEINAATGMATITAQAAAGNYDLRPTASQSIPGTAGKWLWVEFDYEVTGGNLAWYPFSASPATIPAGSGRISRPVLATVATHLFRVGAGIAAKVSNWSVREVSGQFASQATALSRPTLARWPKGGRRNQLTWTADLSNSVWIAANAGDYTMGYPDPFGGNQAIRWKPVFTTDPGGSTRGASLRQAAPGAVTRMRYSIYVKRVKVVSRYPSPPDTTEADRDVFMILQHQSNGVLVINLRTLEVIESASSYISSGVQDVGGGWLRIWLTGQGTVAGNGNTWVSFSNRTSQANFDPYPDGTEEVHLYGTMLELGDHIDLSEPPGPPQIVTTAFDIRQPGSPDIWHLWNDGGDSLPAVLPAGAYEIAWVNHLGVIGYARVTSDGTTGIDLLRAERMADVAVKRGRFTSYEKAQLETQWGKYKP